MTSFPLKEEGLVSTMKNKKRQGSRLQVEQSLFRCGISGLDGLAPGSQWG